MTDMFGAFNAVTTVIRNVIDAMNLVNSVNSRVTDVIGAIDTRITVIKNAIDAQNSTNSKIKSLIFRNKGQVIDKIQLMTKTVIEPSARNMIGDTVIKIKTLDLSSKRRMKKHYP